MLAWILKTNDVNWSDVGSTTPSRHLRGCGFGAIRRKFFQERLDAEVGHGRTEEHRRQFAALDLFHVEFVACFVEELDVVDETLVDVFVEEFLENRVVGRAFGRCQFALAVGRVFSKSSIDDEARS